MDEFNPSQNSHQKSNVDAPIFLSYNFSNTYTIYAFYNNKEYSTCANIP